MGKGVGLEVVDVIGGGALVVFEGGDAFFEGDVATGGGESGVEVEHGIGGVCGDLLEGEGIWVCDPDVVLIGEGDEVGGGLGSGGGGVEGDESEEDG